MLRASTLSRSSVESPRPAAEAEFFIVAGGEAEPLDRGQPLFDDLGQTTFIVYRTRS